MSTLTLDSCTKDTSLSYPSGTAVFTCGEESGVESLTVRTSQTVSLEKVFVFGVPFREVAAPAGSANTGSKFVQCSPGEARVEVLL